MYNICCFVTGFINDLLKLVKKNIHDLRMQIVLNWKIYKPENFYC